MILPLYCTAHSPRSQFEPVYPGGQEQVYRCTPSTHVPTFWQGLLAHWSISAGNKENITLFTNHSRQLRGKRQAHMFEHIEQLNVLKVLNCTVLMLLTHFARSSSLCTQEGRNKCTAVPRPHTCLRSGKGCWRTGRSLQAIKKI